jgi:hypothetical protein
MSDKTTIKVSHETLLRLEKVKPDISKRLRYVRSKDDAINALLDSFYSHLA